MTIRFLLNGRIRTESGIAPTTTVLDYLRDRAGFVGTKEGCAEGDCGACTVVVTRHGSNRFEAVNACLLAMGQLDGSRLLTVEGLAGANGELDPVQQALIDHNSTQCGFCTPGFVMSLYALRQGDETVSDPVIHDALAGNLCRCTGYRPIVDAAREACRTGADRPRGESAAVPDLPVHDSFETGREYWLAPKTLGDLVRCRAQHPDALVLAGGTDLGLLFSKDRRGSPVTISTSHVAELRRLENSPSDLTIGAAVTYTEALPAIDAAFSSFGVIVRRLGSRQIRNVGTIGGNIGNASPIGDAPPCLIALDAILELHGTGGRRAIALETFFVAYRRTSLAPGEVIGAVRVPKLTANQLFRAYKVSKRHDQDISSVVAAFRITLDGGRVSEARIAYGGMAAVPARARETEAALTGKPWSEESMVAAMSAIDRDFSPIDDHRASAAYRRRVAGNLLLRLFRDVQGVGAVNVMAL